MKSHQRITFILLLFLICLFPQPALAYIGPGAGLSAVGAFLAVAAGIIIAMFGFLWYPIKRLRRKFKRKPAEDNSEETE